MTGTPDDGSVVPGLGESGITGTPLFVPGLGESGITGTPLFVPGLGESGITGTPLAHAIAKLATATNANATTRDLTRFRELAIRPSIK